MSEYELYHYGVKGMKWGVRRKRPRLTSDERRAARAEKKQFKSDVKAYRKGQYRDRHNLSFTANTTDNGDGTVSTSNMRYYSNKKRISAKKFQELSEYSNKVATEAAKKRKSIFETTPVRVGSSVCAGLLASSFGGQAISAITGSYDAGVYGGAILGAIAGKKYYDFLSSDD